MQRFFSILLLVFVAIQQHSHAQQTKKTPLDFVNPLIGTAISTTESAKRNSQDGSELRGQTFPAVGVPHGMTSWTPQTQATEMKCIAPYYYEDKYIQGFRGSHWLSGSCTQDYGSVTIMPITGALQIDPSKRASVYSHAAEKSTPSAYSVMLEDYKIKAEVTALSHSGLLQFTFNDRKNAWIVIEPNSDNGEGYVQIDPARNEISGYNPVYRIYQGQGKSAGFNGYFVIIFDAPFETYGTWNGTMLQQQVKQQKGLKTAVGAFVKPLFKKEKIIRAKVGYSFTSIEAARKNLMAEIPDWNFKSVKQNSEKQWNKALNKVEVKGTDEQKTVFYTALYHAKLLPRVVSDVDGAYNEFDKNNKVLQADGFDYYDDFSLWDTYRAVHPLHTLLEPVRTVHMVKSLLKKAQQGGWLPIFPCWNNYTAAMIGDHAIAMIGDALMKGLAKPEAEELYAIMRKNAFEVNTNLEDYRSGKGRRALSSYLEYGYIPLEDSVPDAFHVKEQVSRTLEYAYDDFVLAQVAAKLNKREDYKLLLKRSLNYKNVFDQSTGYVRGRYADGRWISPFDPFALRSSFITEGSPFQYTWYVPQDIPGLITLMGGKGQFINRLDTLFEKRHYWHGNEPGHQSAYLYAYAGAPWKAQQQIATILKAEYGTAPGGLSGNEDAGQMSAWLVFSMMGFYPVCPGVPYYVLGSPSFQQVSISLPEHKTFKVRANNISSKNHYIQSAMLNGKTWNYAYLLHEDIIKGGELVFVMGPKPNPLWGNKVDDLMKSSPSSIQTEK